MKKENNIVMDSGEVSLKKVNSSKEFKKSLEGWHDISMKEFKTSKAVIVGKQEWEELGVNFLFLSGCCLGMFFLLCLFMGIKEYFFSPLLTIKYINAAFFLAVASFLVWYLFNLLSESAFACFWLYNNSEKYSILDKYLFGKVILFMGGGIVGVLFYGGIVLEIWR